MSIIVIFCDQQSRRVDRQQHWLGRGEVSRRNWKTEDKVLPTTDNSCYVTQQNTQCKALSLTTLAVTQQNTQCKALSLTTLAVTQQNTQCKALSLTTLAVTQQNPQCKALSLTTLAMSHNKIHSVRHYY